jgi:HEPN domain-containing protein
MNPDAMGEGRRWLRQAEQDLDDARYNLEGDRYHLVCFLSQQSAEKALKAFLYARGEEMVWGHFRIRAL